MLPGLYPNEKRAVLPFLAASILLLFAGVVTAYLFLPRSLEVLSNIGSEDRFAQFYTADQYLSFFIKMLLAFGIAFEFPLVLVFLQMTGIVQTATLRRQRRIALVLVVIAAAIITPTGDPFTLSVVGVPMYFFYEASLIIGGRLTKNRASLL
ncbi:MAG: twin-arginine translocase subunit TatC [Acidimicrobiales bacterium]